MTRKYLLVLLIAASAVVAILLLSRLFSDALSERLMVQIGGVMKLAALIVAALFSVDTVILLGKGNPARVPWLMLTGGFISYALGQATLVYYQFARGVAPFPSIADVWFIIAYPLLIAGVVAFIAVYRRSGFPTEGTMTMWIVLAIAALALLWPLLRPIIQSDTAFGAKSLNVAYPLLDLLLLIPAIVLLRITSRFRGGSVWHIWLALLTGFVFVAAGDILFAWFSTLGFTKLDPAVHAMYVIAYCGLGAGALIQSRLLRA